MQLSHCGGEGEGVHPRGAVYGESRKVVGESEEMGQVSTNLGPEVL